MQSLTVALDWTPNTNHTGFFVAKALGYYVEAGMVVSLSTPADDNYVITPAKKVELGQADFALCPVESLISYQTKTRPFPLVAVAALLQEDISAIVTLERSGLDTPATLDGKVYASYKARYEDKIVQQMVKKDGGTGEIIINYPEKLGIWNTLLEGQADATWIFLNWEGVLAESEGVKLNRFVLGDYDIPYGYSPVLAANANLVEKKADIYRKFLAATKRGYLYAMENPAEVAKILKPWVPATDQRIDLLKSQIVTNAHYGTEATWGTMAPERVQTFLDWLHQHGLETAPLSVQDLVNDSLLS
ncbi:MAG TPA: ABC transporter substrate-binding protein [Cytophagales bacterium]|nr:ABC transporter substrate-binding protein [Cytophagales bacterium]HAA22424.1 ABC transporter substrate-binding protein [Cytophagales bacterium]HAP62303.1 ABC transporter substrate-binding protein [Cytophagales bacterium]